MKKSGKLTKLVAIALSILLMVSLTACNNEPENKEHFVVGICQLVTHDALDAATQGFKDALTEELAKEGKTVEFKEGNAAGDSNTCSTIVNSFVSENVDLIMANATAAFQAAASATLEIPVLGTSITAYGVALGMDDFDGTIGGNLSGTSDLAPLDEQVNMMLSLVPDAQTVGILYCSAEANSQYQADVVEELLKKEGKTVIVKTFSDSNDISTALNAICDSVDLIFVPTDNTVASNTGIIDQICSLKGVPVFAGEEGICKGCGFATLSISYYNIGVKTGKMAAEILLGNADISETAIQYDEAPVKKFVRSRCEELGITVPSDYEEIVG